MRFYQTKGFALIELLVVIAIIGMLSTVVVSNVSRIRKKAQDVAYAAEMKQLQKSLEMYYLDHGRYPPGPRFTKISELEPFLVPKYIASLPDDKSHTIHNTTVNYGTEYTGDSGCDPKGTGSNHTTNNDQSYIIRYILSSKVNDEFYYFSDVTGVDWYFHCARPLLK